MRVSKYRLGFYIGIACVIGFLIFLFVDFDGKPPEPKVTAEGKDVPTILGTYCWSKGCVDTISPPEMIDIHK